MSSLQLPRYALDEVGQAPTNMPGAPAPGLLPYQNFPLADVAARGYAQILSRMPTASEAESEARADRAFEASIDRANREMVFDAVTGVSKVIMEIGRAEQIAQEKEDRITALKLYEDYRTTLDTVQVNAARAYPKYDEYLATVEVARGKLMQDALAKTENDQQRLFLEGHITPYNIENRSTVLKTATEKRVQSMLADANTVLQAETARIVRAEDPAELERSAKKIDELYKTTLPGLVTADRAASLRQEHVQRALLDRLDREVRENPTLLLAGRLKDYEPGGRIASLFPDVPIRADDIAKARDEAKANTKRMLADMNAQDEATRKRLEDHQKDTVTQAALDVMGVVTRGGDPRGDPTLKAKLDYIDRYGHLLGYGVALKIKEDILAGSAGRYPVPGQEPAVLVKIYNGEYKNAEEILALDGLKPEQTVSLIKQFYERQRTFPYNTEQYAEGVRMITRSVLGTDPDAASRSMMPGFIPDYRVTPEAAANWRAALMDFHTRSKGIREDSLGDLLKFADEISVKFGPKKRSERQQQPAAQPAQQSSSPLPSTSPHRGYVPPQ